MTAPYYIAQPKGVDVPIQGLQQAFAAYLWIGKQNAFYGRVFLNPRPGGQVPEVYVGSGEYHEVLSDDRQDSICFFDVDNNVQIEDSRATATVDIVFFVNLQRIYPGLGHRATEEVEGDVLAVMENQYPRFTVTGITKGWDAYSGYALTDQARQNMQPYYVFSIQTTVSFKYKTCE